MHWSDLDNPDILTTWNTIKHGAKSIHNHTIYHGSHYRLQIISSLAQLCPAFCMDTIAPHCSLGVLTQLFMLQRHPQPPMFTSCVFNKLCRTIYMFWNKLDKNLCSKEIFALVQSLGDQREAYHPPHAATLYKMCCGSPVLYCMLLRQISLVRCVHKEGTETIRTLYCTCRHT